MKRKQLLSAQSNILSLERTTSFKLRHGRVGGHLRWVAKVDVARVRANLSQCACRNLPWMAADAAMTTGDRGRAVRAITQHACILKSARIPASAGMTVVRGHKSNLTSSRRAGCQVGIRMREEGIRDLCKPAVLTVGAGQPKAQKRCPGTVQTPRQQ